MRFLHFLDAFNQLLPRWDVEDQYSYSLHSLDDNYVVQLYDKKDRGRAEKFLLRNAQSTVLQKTDLPESEAQQPAAELNYSLTNPDSFCRSGEDFILELNNKRGRKSFAKFLRKNERIATQQGAEAELLAPYAQLHMSKHVVPEPATSKQLQSESSTENTLLKDVARPTSYEAASPAVQASKAVFGTNKNSNNLGGFFPDLGGKVSSRMEKLFSRLIEIVQSKPFYVEYGDYTDLDSGLFEIKDPVASPDGKFVFDGSGSREFKGGRLTGKGLNVFGSNYQGIASEDWAKSDSSLIRLSDADWGKIVVGEALIEQVGRPKGFQGELYGVNNIRNFIDPYSALANSETGELTNARTISNKLGVDEIAPLNDNALEYSTLHMAFGQYTDHNMSSLARTLTGQGLASQVDPNNLRDPLNRGFTGQLTDDRFENPVETGVLGGRGELHIVKDGKLVSVAYFDAENNDVKPAGFYAFDVNPVNSITVKGDLLLTNDAENRNEIVHRNRTEAMIQNNQLYGSTALQNYYLKESARYNEEDRNFLVYRDELGNVYRREQDPINGVVIGSIVRGDVIKNGQSIAIKNFKISSGVDANGNPIREQLFIDGNQAKPADILKTSHMLSSVAVGTDGLKSLPTYSDLLLNNGVATQLIKNIFEADSDDQYFTGQFGSNPRWIALSGDANFIDFNNVEGYPIIGDISPRVHATDRTSGAMRGLDQNDDNIADAFALLKEANDIARRINPSVRELAVRDFEGNVIDLSENLQPKINAEDWGTGLLLSHVVGGDWRANENVGLTTFHTLWAREHSFHVDWINSTVNALRNNREEKLDFNEAYNLSLDSVTTDDVFNMARRMVEMEYQKILYEQFAPSIVGDIAKIGDHGWDGFNPMVDASVAEEFSNGAYRYGHSQIQELITPGGELFDLFLAPQYAQSYGFSGTINGMTQITAAEIDTKVSESVRSNLLANKLDLKSANINRIRETGQANAQQLLKSLSGYDYIDGKYVFQVHENGKMKDGFAPLNLKNGSDVTHGILGLDGLYGTDDDTPGLDYGFVGNQALKPFKNWEDFGSRLRGDTAAERNKLLAAFMAVYDDSLKNDDGVEDSVNKREGIAKDRIANGDSLGSQGLDQVEVWNFMLAERPSGDHLLGDLASAIVWEQLDRFQDGDSAYYLNSLDGLGGGVWNHTLSSLEDIIARNSSTSTSDNYIDSGFS